MYISELLLICNVISFPEFIRHTSTRTPDDLSRNVVIYMLFYKVQKKFFVLKKLYSDNKNQLWALKKAWFTR